MIVTRDHHLAEISRRVLRDGDQVDQAMFRDYLLERGVPLDDPEEDPVFFLFAARWRAESDGEETAHQAHHEENTGPEKTGQEGQKQAHQAHQKTAPQ